MESVKHAMIDGSVLADADHIIIFLMAKCMNPHIVLNKTIENFLKKKGQQDEFFH